eukprot:3288339-Pyramimonas_sp.AAC.1
MGRMGPRSVRGACPNGTGPPCGRCHWGLRAFGGASYKTTTSGMRALAFAPSVELPIGPRSVCGVFRNRAGQLHVDTAIGPFGGVPCGPRSVWGVCRNWA